MKKTLLSLVVTTAVGFTLCVATPEAESISFEEIRVRLYKKTAVITGVATMKATYKQQDISGKYRFLDVFTRHKGAWKAVATQLTAVASGK